MLPRRSASRRTHEEFFRSYTIVSITLALVIPVLILLDETIYPALVCSGVEVVTTVLSVICYVRLRSM
jgi:hypothetical protein